MLQPISEANILDKESERILINNFLNSLENKITDNEIEKELLRTLRSLNSRDQFRIRFVNNTDSRDDDLVGAYGYYSSFDNTICLIADYKYFETKWFGLKTDYSTFKDEYMNHFLTTCLHELMHYASTNIAENFLKIWRPTMYTFIYNVFQNLCQLSFYNFVDKDVFKSMNYKKFMETNEFKKAFDIYFKSVIINIRFRMKSLVKRYNDILSTLYSKHNFQYARFFDNVFINAIKLSEHRFTKASTDLFNSIRLSYNVIEPTFSDIKMNSLFYQEILDFSEIPCMLSTYYEYVSRNVNNIISTLKLI